MSAEAGMALVEEASDDWSRQVIDQAIRHMAATRLTFSANDVRPLLPPGIRPALCGARFMAAARRREIVKVGWVASTDRATHGHAIGQWRSARYYEHAA